jgi:hypothetical protein
MFVFHISFPFPAASINLSKLLGKLAGLDEAEEREPKGMVVYHQQIMASVQ